MRRVAERLGVGTMTIYGYFRDKDSLLDAVIDTTGAGLVPRVRGKAWQERIRKLMLALHEQLVAHPFLVELRLRRPLMSPEAMRWTEAALSILQDAGLQPGRAAEAFRPLFVYTFGHAAFNRGDADPELVARAQASVLSLTREEFPLVIQAAQELAAALVGTPSYELGLDLLITGVERLIATPENS